MATGKVFKMAYVTLADFRALTGLALPKFTDDMIKSALKLATEIIDTATRQWFEPRALDVRLDGNGTSTLFLNVPIIEVDTLYINGSTTPAERDSYRVYNGKSYPDDRRNPRIKVGGIGNDAFGARNSIYDTSFMAGTVAVFRKGAQNQRILGTFGFVEEDNAPPEQIKHACIKLALYNMGVLRVAGVGRVPPLLPPSLGGGVKSETTDGHSISYNTADRAVRRTGLSALLHGDAELEDIIRAFRGPRGIAVSGTSYVPHGGV